MLIKFIKEAEQFKRAFAKIDKSYLNRVEKLIRKIINDPKIGKPMKYGRKGTREVYLKPFRISYEYIRLENGIILLDLYHKKKQ